MKKDDRPRKRSFLIRKIRHWLYMLLSEEQEEQEIHDAARLWHRSASPCCLCAKPIPDGSLFCPHCGLTQSRQTSGIQTPIPAPLPAQYSPVTSVGSIVRKMHLPDERPFFAYRRLSAIVEEYRKKRHESL